MPPVRGSLAPHVRPEFGSHGGPVSPQPGPSIQASRHRTPVPLYFLLVFSGKQIEKPK